MVPAFEEFLIYVVSIKYGQCNDTALMIKARVCGGGTLHSAGEVDYKAGKRQYFQKILMLDVNNLK